jgi:hypothetical protein
MGSIDQTDFVISLFLCNNSYADLVGAELAPHQMSADRVIKT